MGRHRLGHLSRLALHLIEQIALLAHLDRHAPRESHLLGQPPLLLSHCLRMARMESLQHPLGSPQSFFGVYVRSFEDRVPLFERVQLAVRERELLLQFFLGAHLRHQRLAHARLLLLRLLLDGEARLLQAVALGSRLLEQLGELSGSVAPAALQQPLHLAHGLALALPLAHSPRLILNGSQCVTEHPHLCLCALEVAHEVALAGLERVLGILGTFLECLHPLSQQARPFSVRLTQPRDLRRHQVP